MKGFTVPEIMLVLGICALVAVLGLPAFNGTLARARLGRSAETIAADLRLARHLALTWQVPVYVSFSTADQCYAISAEPDCPCNKQGPDCLLNSPLRRHARRVDKNEFGSVQLTEVQFGQTETTGFTPPRGSARFGHVILSNRYRQRLKLSLSLPGRVRICNPDPATTYPGYPRC